MNNRIIQNEKSPKKCSNSQKNTDGNNKDCTTTILIEKKIPKLGEITRFSKKDLAIEYLNSSDDKQLKLFSEDLGIKGAKSYITITYQHLYQLCVSQKSPHYYENIERNMPVKFHMDIDLKVNINKKAKLNRIFDKTVKESIDLINNEFKKENINDPQIIVLKSDYTKTIDNISKISAHLIYNNVVFDDIYDMKHFLLKIKSNLIDNKIIDKNIYRIGCFRMLHCSKKGKNNKLRFCKSINYTLENEEKLFYDSMVTHFFENQVVHNIKSNIQINDNLKKEKLLKCKKRISKINDYFYVFTDKELQLFTALVDTIKVDQLDDYNTWILITYSFIDLYENIDKKFQKMLYKLWDSLCKKGKCYDKTNNKKIFFSLKLDYINANYIPIILNSDFRFKKVIRYEKIKSNFSDYTVDKLNSRYVSDSIYETASKNDIITVKSFPGTGKTTLLNKVFDIKQINGKNVHNFDRPIISITSRKNLAEKHANDLGIINYKKNNDYLFDIDRVAITVNSLIKIDEDKYKDCYLVLDETSKVLSYLKSNVLNGIRYDVYQIFCKIIMNSKKIIILDADLGEIDLRTIINIRKLGSNSANYYLAINEFKTKTGINAYFYDNPHIVAEMLINDFINKVPFICALDSLTKMKQIINEIKKKAIDMKLIDQIDKLLKVYSSEEDDDTFDINILKKKLGILFTPIMIYGIDINSKIPRKVYAFAFKKILTPYEINQQIQRERNHSEAHIFVNQHIGQLKYDNKDDFRIDVQNRINKYNETINEIIEINKVDMSDAPVKDNNMKKIFNDLYVETTFMEETTKVHMEYYLKNIMADMGYNIIEKKEKTTFEIKQDKQLDEKIKTDIIDKFQSEGILNSKIKDKIIRRMEIMNIKTEQLNDFTKKIIMNDSKFTDYLNLKRFLSGKLEDKIIENNKRELDECSSTNIYYKLREFKKIVTVLGIKNDIEFNYDADSKKFKDKIEDKKLIDDLNTIKKMFRFKSNKYFDFDKIDGYEKLYKMAISMSRQLFGNDFLDIIKFNTKIKNKDITIYKYYTNISYVANVKSI
ncbi:hypothetical protein Catovirus_1_78 [Catovirus CTV1]|uniref:Replication origin-binding protein domain-containing protein n=1 Tax=Catovirus CTV1 TaxID=1977631 RepID=A0A1V0S8R6_9VIRU|nr:hypothetical protein Catovirus_1_78 [Catovirus CTV1]